MPTDGSQAPVRVNPALVALPGASGVPRLAQGSFRGGNTVVISGCGFEDGTEVLFDGRPATSVTFVGPTELRVVVPANRGIPRPTRGPASGKIRQVVLYSLDVSVTVSRGGFASTLEDAYRYLPEL